MREHINGTRTPRRLVALALIGAAALGTGCEPDGAPGARKALLEEHVPRVKELLREDREKTWEAIQEAGRRLAPGFEVEDPDSREAQMRTALKRVQELPRGISGLVVSPISFLAAVDAEGVVIARDVDDADDRMQGQDFAERFPAVATALETGQPQMAIVTFESEDESDDFNRSSILFVGPAHRNGQVVGAAVAGIPLWREAQRLSRQLRVELAPQVHEGLIIWALMYQGDDIIVPPDAPSELTPELPDGATLQAKLQESPQGYTGEFQAYQKWYGYAVVPTPTLADDIGVLVLRAGEGEEE